jgi:hypothetical protein
MTDAKPEFEVYRPPKFRTVNAAHSVAQGIRELLTMQCEYIRGGGRSEPIVKFWQDVAQFATDELREAIHAPKAPKPPTPTVTQYDLPMRPRVRRV